MGQWAFDRCPDDCGFVFSMAGETFRQSDSRTSGVQSLFLRNLTIIGKLFFPFSVV